MIKVKKNSQQKRKRNRQEHIPNINIPEPHQPPPINRGKKRLARRKSSNINIPHMTDMHKPGKEHNRQRSTIVIQELPNIALEETAVSELATDPSTH